MKFLASLGWLVPAMLGTAQPTDAIRQIVLDPDIVVRIPVGRDRVTTVRFPTPISALEGFLISTNSDPPGRFQISFRPGNPFFSLRALSQDSIVNLNIVWRNRTYVLELVESAQPLLSIVFVEPNRPPPPVSSRTVNAVRVREMFDIARSYSLLQAQHPQVISNVEYAQSGRSFAYRDCDLTLEEVFGFRTEDVLVFRTSLSNKTDRPLCYDPRSLTVGLGPSILPAAAVDASGMIPSRSRETAWFAVMGGLGRTPVSVSSSNEFTLSLDLPIESPTRAPLRTTQQRFKPAGLQR